MRQRALYLAILDIAGHVNLTFVRSNNNDKFKFLEGRASKNSPARIRILLKHCNADAAS